MVKELKELYRTPRRLGEHYELFSEYVDPFGGWIKPTHKDNGRKPRIALYVDPAPIDPALTFGALYEVGSKMLRFM